MTNKLINKLKMGALTLALAGSLTSCYKKYNLDGEIVKYNKDLASPLEIRTKDSVFTYTISKDNRDSVESVELFPCPNGKCKMVGLKTYSIYGKDKEKIINDYQKRFTNYVNKINQIKN